MKTPGYCMKYMKCQNKRNIKFIQVSDLQIKEVYNYFFWFVNLIPEMEKVCKEIPCKL